MLGKTRHAAARFMPNVEKSNDGIPVIDVEFLFIRANCVVIRYNQRRLYGMDKTMIFWQIILILWL
jgi:hypothetical protein